VARVTSGRSVALVAVVLVHVGLVKVLGFAMRNRPGAVPLEPVTTLIALDIPPAAPEPRLPESRKPTFAAPSTAITVPPLPAQLPTGQVDWGAAARGAATDVGQAPTPRSLDHNPATDAPSAPSSPAVVVHHAGEQYRDPADGTSIVYVSDHCYIASSPAPTGTADVIARARSTRTVCKGDPGWSRPDLFRDLPAYEKYHSRSPGQP
jgi:hypothetical protein